MDKTMLYGTLTTILIGLFLLFLGVNIGNEVSYKMDELKLKYESHLNDKVIINKDTLTIVNYSIWNEEFELSNGQKVSYKFIENK